MLLVKLIQCQAQEDTVNLKYGFLSSHFRTYSDNQEVPFITTVTSKLILYGERHDEPQSQTYFLSLFKTCLRNDSSFRLLLEGGPSEEYLLREYIRTGSRKVIIDGLPVWMCSSKEEKKYFQPVRDIIVNNASYNDSIRYIYAIDCERHYSISLMTLGYILDKSFAQFGPQTANTRDTLLKYFSSQNKSILQRSVRYIIQDFNIDSLKYFTKLSTMEYLYYSRIVKALQAGLTYDSLGGVNNNEAASFRETFMFNNLYKVLAGDSQHRFVGEFGITHVVSSQERWMYYRQWESLAAHIANCFPGQLCRIVNYYIGEDHFENKVIISESNIDMFRSFIHKHNATIFDLRNGKSLFNTEFDFVQILN